jgi:DUF2897 family protein
MTTAIIVIVVVLAILVGTILSFRNSAKTGMPSEDVLKRATARARELEAREKSEDERS